MNKPKSKREILRDKVLDLVKGFIEAEGDITMNDIQELFGAPIGGKDKICAHLAKMPINLRC